MIQNFLGPQDFLRFGVLQDIQPAALNGLGCDERRSGFRPFPALLSEVQKKGNGDKICH
jgi:hypothetical protein